MDWKKPTYMLLIFTLILSMAIISVDADPQLPKLYVDPPKYTATQLGEVFTIDINIANVTDLKGFEFKLSYNTTLLDTLIATVGPFPPRPLIWSRIEINETAGYVFVSAVFETVEGNGTLATITFNTTYLGPASCTLHLYETGLSDPAGSPIDHQVEDGYYEFVILSITVATDKATYLPGKNVQVHVNLTLDGSPHEGLVALEVDNQGNYGIVRRTLQIGPPPTPGNITIIDLYPSNQWGDPTGSFTRGTPAWFTVNVSNSGTEWVDVAITVNPYDGAMVPLGAPTLLTTMGPGISRLVQSIAIPTWAYVGTGTVYASVFTDLPRDGGVPYCPEKSANFTITASLGGASAPETQSSGNYTLTFKLPPNSLTGIYRVYASARYLNQHAMGNTLFGVKTIGVPDHYSTIQEAVDAATPTNNTIIVGPGTYTENVNINKSVRLIGVDPTNTIINGNATGTVVTITANNVEISRFTIKNGGSSPDSGIALIDSSDSTISKNTITSNKGYGIYLNHSTGTTLKDNTMICNKYNFGVFGDSLSHFIHDIDTTNTVDGKPVIYWINKQNSQIPPNAGFVAIVNSTEIVVRGLDLTKEGQGVLLAFTNDALIERVNTVNNEYGIYMVNSHNNKIVGSKVSNNTVGIYQSHSNQSIICHNNFINNTNQAELYQSSNTWDDSGGKGNYWSNYTGDDDGSGGRVPGDGVGDTLLPHQGVDWYPLMNPWILVHDVAITNVTPVLPCIESHLYPGWPINVSVNVKNEGDFTETFNIIGYYDNTNFDTKPLPELTPQRETAINLTWDTEGVSPGNYNISAEAVLPSDTDTTDNTYTDGNLTLLVPTVHDVALTSVAPVLPYNTSHAYKCWVVDVTATVKNEGHYKEVFNVTAYYDGNLIDTKTVTLYPLANKTLTLTWNVAGVTPGFNYTISANISSVIQGEVDTSDNMLADGDVNVRKCGDIDGDNRVGMFDIILLGKSLLKKPGDPGFNPYADLDRDGRVGMFDIIILGQNLLK